MGSSWKAISDESRRQVLLLLKDGEKTPTEMSKSFDFSMAALSTHLRVLRDADLVQERKVGQHRYYSVNREKMSEMRLFFEGFWDDALLNLKRHAESKAAKRGW
ncbi:MAG TPA: metalloregulator ArsR/SmtB family transcription factor [Nitrososphaerales archaeon]|nr:metalloregulator ArsR/SmtB family transcription factor [Nitrososphaerales archaeon]HUK75596.1 metalloregulator ArsR/SmtB family transcription factor [Nitrososphaerales archaeon]